MRRAVVLFTAVVHLLLLDAVTKELAACRLGDGSPPEKRMTRMPFSMPETISSRLFSPGAMTTLEPEPGARTPPTRFAPYWLRRKLLRTPSLITSKSSAG